jgi:DNA-binding NarL/FixJ family response regulator
MSAIKIVLADDHEMFRSAVFDFLEKWPEFRVVSQASSGPEAIAKVQEQDPDILLLDVRLPEFDGVSVIKTLASRRSPTRVLALSAFSDQEYVTGIIDHGGYGYLLKVETPQVVLDVLRQIAAGERYFFSQEIEELLHEWGYRLENRLKR